MSLQSLANPSGASNSSLVFSRQAFKYQWPNNWVTVHAWHKGLGFRLPINTQFETVLTTRASDVTESGSNLNVVLHLLPKTWTQKNSAIRLVSKGSYV